LDLSGIFISYRRDDSFGHAGRVYDGLAASFGAERVDIDIDAIEPGDDFVDRITMAVVSSAACLVVIGPRWLRAEDEDGRWRLGEADDFVRVEIETAPRRLEPASSSSP
jgi:hypothetical protein